MGEWDSFFHRPPSSPPTQPPPPPPLLSRPVDSGFVLPHGHRPRPRPGHHAPGAGDDERGGCVAGRRAREADGQERNVRGGLVRRGRKKGMYCVWRYGNDNYLRKTLLGGTMITNCNVACLLDAGQRASRCWLLVRSRFANTGSDEAIKLTLHTASEGRNEAYAERNPFVFCRVTLANTPHSIFASTTS